MQDAIPSSTRYTSDWFKTDEGTRLFTRCWEAAGDEVPNGVILIVHGLGEHSGRYQTTAEWFNQQGWNVLAYDQRGHGQSDGPRGRVQNKNDLVRDLSQIVHAFRCDSRYIPALERSFGILGHSLGGLVASRYLTDTRSPSNAIDRVHQGRPDFCILSSPALAVHLSPVQRFLMRTLGTYLPQFTVPNGIKPSWLAKKQSVVDAYIADPLVHRRASGLLVQFMIESIRIVEDGMANWDLPTILLYAGLDRCVDPKGSQRLINANTGDTIRHYAFDDLGHEVLQEDSPQVMEPLQSWLNEMAARGHETE